MAKEKKDKNKQNNGDSKPDNTVIVGKKEWHDYAVAILGRLEFGPVGLKARGLEGVMKTANACCFATKHYNVVVTLTIVKGSFDKDGQTIELPVLEGKVTGPAGQMKKE